MLLYVCLNNTLCNEERHVILPLISFFLVDDTTTENPKTIVFVLGLYSGQDGDQRRPSPNTRYGKGKIDILKKFNTRMHIRLEANSL
jgi:hypothetical protein